MKLAQQFLKYYSLCLTVFITAGAAVASVQTRNPLFLVLFIPVLVYFILKVLKPNIGHKLLLYYNFVLTSVLGISGFIGATSTAEVVSAVLFIPITIYFWLLVVPKRREQLVVAEQPETKKAEESKPEDKELDNDRRTFLKLVGSIGLGVFFVSLFSRKMEDSVFGGKYFPQQLKNNTPAAQPTPASPTDSYEISEIDDSDPTYFGFINKTGNWYIMKETDGGSFRYVKGEKNFAFNWSKRDTLEYGYYNKVF